MAENNFRQRLWATLLMLGAGVLIFRCVHLLANGGMMILTWWVIVMTFTELLIDIACLVSALRWWLVNDRRQDRIPLRLGAAAAILHAIRVLVFVLGRTSAFLNFDVRPEYHSSHSERWSWFWVYFAASLSILGILGVLIIWQVRRFVRNKQKI
jgi:hypothetical protein